MLERVKQQTTAQAYGYRGERESIERVRDSKRESIERESIESTSRTLIERKRAMPAVY